MSRRSKIKVEKTKLCVSIPTELLEECDYYMENYSKYFTKCLESFLNNIKKKEMDLERKENTDIIQTKRTTKNVYSTPPPENSQNEEVDDEEYDSLLARFLAMRENKKYI